MASILGLSGSVVGVRLLASPEALVKVQRLERHRYCQALMRARRGQPVILDSTIVPYLENRLNFGYGCYGCRDATDLGQNETVVGFPAALLPAMVSPLEFLAQKAIPTLRSKKAWAALEKRGAIGVTAT